MLIELIVFVVMFTDDCPDSTASQHQYWARQIASFISVLIQNYEHVSFNTCQYNASLGQDMQV